MQSLYLYPLTIRIWHVVNALFFLILIITGVSLQYTDPEGFIIPFRLAITLHNISAIVVTCSFIYFLFANRLSGNYIYYRFRKGDDWKGLKAQARYYINGMFKGMEHPFEESLERKFNPLQ